MMLKNRTLALMAGGLLTASACAQKPATPPADAQACHALQNSRIYKTTVTSAEWLTDAAMAGDRTAGLTGASANDQKLPPHCLVKGELERRTGADGKSYATQFELRLPQNWNSKFLFQGGGGTNGFVGSAFGSTPSRGSTATPALIRGYAVVATDTGHQGRDAAFGADQQARLDYAYAAIGKVTDVAKQLISLYYGKPAAKNYFMGCSNGGREAMLAAQRYPLEFDGVVAGNPGFRLAEAAVGEAWDNRHFMQAAPSNAQGEKIFADALTQADLDILSQGVLDRCDAKDGLKDGIINAWEQCDFKPQMVQDKLGGQKVQLLENIFNGAKNSRGENVYSGWFYDAGVNQPNWRQWKLGDAQTATPNALNMRLGMNSLTQYFMTPYSPDFNPLDFDFDRDTAKVAQIAGIHNADKTDLSTFKARGGKMIIFHGVSDPVFSAADLRDWFVQMGKDTPGQADFAKLFMVPGMTHCGGGSALDDIDPLTALENWTDKGEAPRALIGKGSGAFKGRSQPICAYPQTAHYTGGDKDKAESFICR